MTTPIEAAYGRRWLRKRTPDSTAQGRRVRVLFRKFIEPLNADDPIAEAAALAAAELTVAVEDARARLLAGDVAAEGAVVRLENAARRARLDLDQSADVVEKSRSPRTFQERMAAREARLAAAANAEDDDETI